MSPVTTTELLQGIADKLEGILAFMAAKDCKGDATLIVPKLRSMGMSNKTIALVAGITENAVSIRVSRMKKPKSAKSGKRVEKKQARATSTTDDLPGNGDSETSST